MNGETRYLYTITVEGDGEFPIDMLRYDGCYPDTQDDVVRMEGDRLAGPELDMRSVRLRAWKPRGWLPTRARWESFGWRVTEWRNHL